MLKKRIIPVQLLNHGRLVKSVNFDNFRDVGDPVSSTKIYNSQYADELIFLNIDRERDSIETLLETLEKISSFAFMPISCGGGIMSENDATELILAGADKVILNSILYEDLNIIERISSRHGSQAVVVCLDVRFNKDKKIYQLYSNNGEKIQKISLEEHCERLAKCNIGEIMIQSIDRDGMMLGYDHYLINHCIKYIDVPVIAAGGSSCYDTLLKLFQETNVSGACCGSIFNFSDSNLIRAKSYLKNNNLPMKVI